MDAQEKRAAAKKTDWKTLDMPAQHTTYTLKRKISASEMKTLKLGHIPQEMEDK